ncbi:MAG: hypothetical protein ABEN55_10580, partial [Bradymonadaceae bacterium]
YTHWGSSPYERQTSTVSERPIRIQFEYDGAGRMRHRTVERATEESGEFEMVSERHRTFRSDGTGGVTEDRWTSYRDGSRHERRTLSFERGDNGQLKRRVLTVDGERVEY